MSKQRKDKIRLQDLDETKYPKLDLDEQFRQARNYINRLAVKTFHPRYLDK